MKITCQRLDPLYSKTLGKKGLFTWDGLQHDAALQCKITAAGHCT